MATLGQRVRKQREKLGLSRYQLAKDSGVDAASVHRIENGIQTGVRVETAEKLAKVLHVLPSTLLGIK